MANTTADKLALLQATKADLKAALAEKGQTVGDVFSTYPAAVRAIETGGGTATLTVSYAGVTDTTCIFVNADGSLIQSQDGTNTGQHTIPVPSLVLAVSIADSGTEINGAAENVFTFKSLLQVRICTLVLVTGNAAITY